MTPKRRIIPLFIPHYGCKHDCVFCNQRRITNLSEPDCAGQAIKTLSELDISEFQTPVEIAFYGGSFTALPEGLQAGLLEAAQPYLRYNPHSSIRVSTRPDCIDAGIVTRLRGYGVKTIELGAQSMCDDVLMASCRGHTSDDVERSARVIKGAGLYLILQMMTGLPGDTPEKSIYTARRLISLCPDGVRIYPAVVVRDTALYDMWLGGAYKEHTIDEAVALCARLCPLFEQAGVPVIRLGLNPTDALSAGGAVAGAYSPAFGEMVYSKLYYIKAAGLLEGVAPGSDVVLTVANGCISKMVGNRRHNANDLAERFKLRSLKVAESDEVPRGEVRCVAYCN